MDIHVLCYGLGNQLSQYAFYLNRQGMKQRAHAFYAFKQHNGYELHRIFGLKQGLPWYLQFIRIAFRLGISRRFYSERTANFVLSLLRIKIVVEPGTYGFDPDLMKPWSGIRILWGGWHDPRYYHPSEHLVREAYALPVLDGKNQALLQQIDGNYSVSVHVRRGDYLKGKNQELFGNLATLDYYRNAIDWTESNCGGRVPTFFVFSDDLAWCKKHLGLKNAVFVDVNSGKDSWKDLVLMARCSVNIIANSTFSWWAAWLNSRPDKAVICPTKFVNSDTAGQTIYPSTWHHIEG